MESLKDRSLTVAAGFPTTDLASFTAVWSVPDQSAAQQVELAAKPLPRQIASDQTLAATEPEPEPVEPPTPSPARQAPVTLDLAFVEVTGNHDATEGASFLAPARALADDFGGIKLPAFLAQAAVPSAFTVQPDVAQSGDLKTGPNSDGVEVSAFSQVNTDGWGDPENVYAWAMFSFGGMLYVTTLSLDGTQPDNEGIRSEGSVYRYDGTDWEVVTENGFGNDHNDGFRCLYEYDGHLYTGSLNELDGAELWRTSDGVTWELVADQGFGDPTNQAIREMVEFQGKLFVGTQNISQGAGDIWMSSDGVNFTPVTTDGFGSIDNSSFHCFIEYAGMIYVGTRNLDHGGELWRSADGETWEQVVGDVAAISGGFGSVDNDAIFHMMAFQGALYATTGNSIDGFGLFRSTDGETWEQIGDYGFGHSTNTFGWRMEVHDGALWLGASNSEPTEGGTLWRSTDGLVWEQMVGAESDNDGYGFDNIQNWGIRSLEVYNDQLYVGTANYPYHELGTKADGAQVFVYLDGTLALTGTDGDDLINGSSEGDSLTGEAGNDTISGKGGNDTIMGGIGDDSLRGNQGSDQIDGGDGDDSIRCDAGFDGVDAGAGNDFVEGNQGEDTISGGEGMDTLFGGAKNDQIFGGRGADMLFGEDGADFLDGGRNFDVLDGGNGKDTLVGGAGDDTMTGGLGTDDFVFEEGNDIITDFAQDKDELQLAATLFAGPPPTVDEIIDMAVVQDGNLVFDFGDGNVLTLEGMTKANLLWNDIVIV